MMSMADALEARGIEIGERRGEQRGIEIGERRGEQRGIEIGERRGIVKVLLQFGKTDEEIIQYLTTDLNDPLTEDEAAEVLESCRKGNR